MIVNIAGWLYIVQAVIGLSSLVMGPFGLHASRENLVALVFHGLFGAMGIGLLKRHPTARWFALGISLLGWTLGAIGLLGIIGAAVIGAGAIGVFGGNASPGLFSGFAFVMLAVLLIFAAGVVISFKLYWYLCSRDGCMEFGVPYGSSSTVVASVGAWVGIWFLYVFFATGGPLGWMPTFPSDSASEEVDRQGRDIARERERHAAERDAAERNERIAREQLEAARAAEAQQQSTDTPTDSPVVEEAPAPTIDVAPSVNTTAAEEEKPDANRILKCRDGSGGISYTQGYCPPGTKEVATPKPE